MMMTTKKMMMMMTKKVRSYDPLGVSERLGIVVVVIPAANHFPCAST